MVGTDLLHANTMSPSVFYSGQLSTTDTTVFSSLTNNSAKIFQAVVCNSSSSQIPPTLSLAQTNQQISAPTISLGTTAGSGGTFAANTYYWVLTATTTYGETTVSNEIHATISANGTQTINWSVVAGATGYKLYRGTAAAGENVLVTTISSGATVTYLDTGTSASSATPPSSNTSGGGTFGAGTYFWVITATSTAGQTIASNEVTATLTVNGSVIFTWNAIAAANGYKIYRGTATGAENILVATISGGSTTTYTDTGSAGTSASPPGTSSFAIAATVWISVVPSGGSIDATHKIYNNFAVAVDATIKLDSLINTCLGPGDYIAAKASIPGVVVLEFSGTVQT